MKAKMTKVMALVLMLIMVSVLSACSSKLPKGRYEPVESSTALTVQAIVISGNNFTVEMPLLGGMTVKYSYNKKTGAITLTDGTTGLTSSEYKDGSIWYGGAEFKKSK